ncbi:glycosyltransferase [Candidatus Heimdallarchaeota archaeon]|nr:MAG: glycosyltransferase [Candidatus Heimdallarchaeota archaeon]
MSEPRMQWKKSLWYSLTILLLVFLAFYIGYSSYYIVYKLTPYLPNWKAILGLLLNFLILFLELLSTFYSIFIYYFIGSSSSYRILKDENNKYLASSPLPKVAIIIPLYKEPLKVVSKTIDGALKLDYPHDRYDVIVCDDSPSDISTDIKDYCDDKGVRFIQRESRKGFKAGALNNVLQQIDCDFFGVLDSDHIPTPNFIRTCLAGFTDDDVVIVQGKPMFVNQEDYLMRSSSFIHTQFFHIYQKSRGTRDGVIFAGTTGMFRTEILRKFGGLLEDTLAEDTDTSFMLMSKGYKTRYIHEICSNGLVPWNPISMINQVCRWTNGITSIFRKRFFKILRGKNSIINKIDATSTILTPIIGVTMWFVYLLLFVMYMLSEQTLGGIIEFKFLRPDLGQISFVGLFAPILISIASLVMAFVSWRRESKEDRMIKLRGFFGMIWTIAAFYILMMVAQSFLIWAVLSALIGVKKEFDRTVKEKTRTIGKMSQKIKYALWSFGLFLISGAYFYATYHAFFISGSFLSGWFIIAAITALIPIIITITHFRKLEAMHEIAATTTAADIQDESGD